MMPTNTNSRTTPVPSRLAALDGLRGIAAVIVVIWHALLSTSLAEQVPGLLTADMTGADPTISSPAWWLFDTPLRMFSVGISAVTVFFVLSGFVLAYPVMRGKALDLWSYYPRRILRLWIPSAVSVLLALVIIVATRQNPDNAASNWGAEFSFPTLDPEKVGESFFLITGTNQYNNPLWSLKWELLFSLFLPAALALGMLARTTAWQWTAIVVCIAASAWGDMQQISALQYGPMFLIGVFAARLVVARTTPPSSRASWVAVLGGTGLIMVPEIARTLFNANLHTPLGRSLSAFVLLGATLMILGLCQPSGVSRAFAGRPAAFLGRISFSLYLVHVPIILSGVHVFGGAFWALCVTVPLSFLVAWVFARFVETPSANFARSVGERAARILGPPAPRERELSRAS